MRVFHRGIEMRNRETGTTDHLVRNERRGVWLALFVILTLGATLLLGTDTRRALLTGMVVTIVFSVTWLSQAAGRGLRAERRKNRDAVMHDELRGTALAAAYKGAFFSVLGALAAFCLLSTVMTVDLPAAMVCALTIVLGASVFLALFLLLDRV